MVSTEILSKFDLFADIAKDQLEEIAKLAEEISFEKGVTIFNEGQKAEELFFLLEGEIALQIQLTSRPVKITTLIVNQSNQNFGWSSVVPPYFFTASAVCNENSRVVAVNGKEFMKILENEPVMGFQVMRRITQIISNRLRICRTSMLKTL
ncbi:MAG: cyclic nucleotide-binding domain-containing protein [Anaerolineaceae bacterium]|nr:cyclic nucleotide-binding domain-containing protein [Anaerolineaceae bacterium]